MLRRHVGIAAQARDEPRRPAQDKRQGDDRRRQRDQETRAGRFRDRSHQSARRDGYAAQARHRFRERPNRRAGGRARLGALPHLSRVGARRVDGECFRDGAGRARRRHGADSQLHHGRRTADRAADRGEAARGNREAHARRWRRDRRADEDLVVLRGGNRGLQNGRGVHARSQVRCCRAPRTSTASMA